MFGKDKQVEDLKKVFGSTLWRWPYHLSASETPDTNVRILVYLVIYDYG